MDNFDIKKNRIYIGDNLKVLNSDEFKSFARKINFIYIDPPYNTKNPKFSYEDSNLEWGNDLRQRLMVSRNLLSEDGVIFISIDDHEYSNLLNICYEVFGEKNYIGTFITKQAIRSNSKFINIIHEYVICFCLYKNKVDPFYIKRLENPLVKPKIEYIIKEIKKLYFKDKKAASQFLKEYIKNYILSTGETWIKNYSSIDENGEIYFAKDLSTPGKPCSIDIDEIDLHLKPLKTRGWSSKNKIFDLYKKNRLVYKKGRPYEKQYLYESYDNVTSLLNFYSRQGTNDLKKIGLDGLFDTPKPVELIKFLIRCSQHKNGIILDFYSGSGTTAQAVYEINEEDNMDHNYILIQSNEEVNKKSESYKFLNNLGILKPTMQNVLTIRIDTFLNIKKMEKDYILEDFTDGVI